MSAPVISVRVIKLNLSICPIVYNNPCNNWDKSGYNCNYFGEPSLTNWNPKKCHYRIMTKMQFWPSYFVPAQEFWHGWNAVDWQGEYGQNERSISPRVSTSVEGQLAKCDRTGVRKCEEKWHVEPHISFPWKTVETFGILVWSACSVEYASVNWLQQLSLMKKTAYRNRLSRSCGFGPRTAVPYHREYSILLAVNLDHWQPPFLPLVEWAEKRRQCAKCPNHDGHTCNWMLTYGKV